MEDRYSEVPEAKSLRWIANNFPWIDDPKDDIERMNNAIHLYTSRGADLIDKLSSELKREVIE